MAGIIFAAILNTVSKEDYNLTSLCPTIINLLCYLFLFLCAATLLTLSTIAVDRLLAVSLHLRYQELVTSKRVTIVLISIWLTSSITALMYIFLPKSNEMVAAVILLVGYVLTTVAYVRIYKVVKYHQNQIYSQNQLQNAQTREALRQRKSAYNALFVYFVFLVCYLPYLPSVILYLTDTSEISFLIARYASLFLICLNSSLNPIVYCWRYREIRQIVKSTMKKILRMDENMTWWCDVLRDEICWERAILEGNWDELTFGKTFGTVTRDKGKMTKNDRADERVHTWVTVPRKNCGKYFELNRFKSGEGTCCAQRPRKGVNGRRLVATIGIGLSIENLKTDTFELNSVYNFHEM